MFARTTSSSCGRYQTLESKYFKSNGFDTVAAFTCGVDPAKFPYPPAASATGALGRALARKTLRCDRGSNAGPADL